MNLCFRTPERIAACWALAFAAGMTCAGAVSDLRSSISETSDEEIWSDLRSFDGYTNHWKSEASTWSHARGLFTLSRPTVQSEIRAMEIEIGNQLMLEELWIEPGFVHELVGRSVTELESPTAEELEAALSEGDALVLVTDRDPLAVELLELVPEEIQFRRNRAFLLRRGERVVFVLACHSKDELARLRAHIDQAADVVRKYDFRRGLAGVSTNYLHITPPQRHNPFDLIDIALDLGCSWLSVNGFNDWMLPGPVNEALDDVGFSFPFISGQTVTAGALYGMTHYPDIQDNTVEECLDWAKEKGGYYFSSLSEAESDHADRFHGYLLGGSSDWERIAELDAPFVTKAGDIQGGVPTTLVAFLEKGAAVTQSSVMEAILAKRAVAVFSGGALAGPPEFRDALRILLLERTVIEEALHGPVRLEAKIENRTLSVTAHNRTTSAVRGAIRFRTGETVAVVAGSGDDVVELAAGETSVQTFPLRFTPEASGQDNVVSVSLVGEGLLARALAHVDIPRAVETNPLILEAPGEIVYPVTVYNYTDADSVSLNVSVSRKGGDNVVELERELDVAPGSMKRMNIPLSLEAGDYEVNASALGVTVTSAISVRAQEGEATAREEDLDGDGVPEIVLENDAIRATVLLTGGRVIEYIVKSRDENLMFKLWPEKPPLAGTVGGTRSFYPYGGLEEFTGYPYIGGHIVFKYEIQSDSGPYARVRVWANIHGSKIEKWFTLFADSPILEARYAMEEMTPTLNVIGINPLFEIGPSTGPEDRYYFPEEELVETVPELERYYGRGVFGKEGWAAGYDTEEDISLLIGYPVNDAIYLHLWNNHPNNTPTPYYYTELQPWLELKHGTTTYFSYYVYGKEGPWKPLVEEYRDLGLMTEREFEKPWTY